jgi:hypothetical protein
MKRSNTGRKKELILRLLSDTSNDRSYSTKRENEATPKIKHGEMKQTTSEMKQQQIEWRRAKVLELSSQGYTEREIAEKLQPISPVTIHRDLVYLRQQAQENLQKHIHEVIPSEYEKCMVGMKRNLKRVTEIQESTSGPKIKLDHNGCNEVCNKAARTDKHVNARRKDSSIRERNNYRRCLLIS